MYGELPAKGDHCQKKKKKKTEVLHVDENGVKSIWRGSKANFLQNTMYV